MSRAVVELRLARRSPCPHCGHNTNTVQGVCADCWGSKEEGRREFFFRKRRTSSAWFSPDDVLILFSVAVGMGVIYVLVRSI